MMIGMTPMLRMSANSSRKLTAEIAMPMRTSTIDQRDSGRQRSDGEIPYSTWTSPSSSSACRVAILLSTVAQPVDRGPEHRQRDGRGWRPLELRELVADRDRRAVALVAVLGGVALDGQSLRLAGLLEHRASLEQRGLGLGAVVARDGERVAVVLQALERVLARLQLGGRLRDRVLGDLEPARVLDAPRLEVVDRALELALGAAGAAVGAADRGLEPVAQGALVALEAGELVVADGGRRAEEALRRDARDRGELLVGARRVGDRVAAELEADRALRAAERLRQPPSRAPPSSSS